MTITDFIKQGEDLKAGINGVRLGKIDEYNVWVETVLRFLNKTMPGDMAIDRFQKQINFFNPRYCYKHEFDSILSILKGVEAIPSKTIDTSAQAKKVEKGIEINNTLSQNQNQEQHQDQKVVANILLACVKDELTGKQRKELLSVINEFKDPKEAYVSVVEKLKEFGIDISANIVANILTSPTIWSTIDTIL